jgi:arylsulfatase A-like enzyme
LTGTKQKEIDLMKRSNRMFTLIGALIALASCVSNAALAGDKPNVLFISVDDLNDWIGCLGGHPQTRTPNFDRLAASSVLFNNAHCPGASCNPSRTAIMTGLSPHRSGLYQNGQKMRNVLPDAELLPKYFGNHGYWSAGSGKLLHYFIDARSWDEYFPAKETEDPFPRTLYPDKRPVSLPRGGPWQYVETDWAALDATDEEFGGDWLVSKYIGEKLGQKHDKPFFLGCGIYRPHEPWFVPKKYFDLFPLADIQLPPGYKEDDLDDLPQAGKKRGPNRYFAHIRNQGQWKQGIQGYLASIAFADAMLGRVIDALENGPNRKNTIVVLWSDHGWHLGEKQHWQKYTAWRACTRVPLMIRVPAGVPGLPTGTKPGVSSRPVNLLSLYPTLIELSGLPAKSDNHGPSLVPLLEDPAADWNHVSITHLGEPGTFGLSAQGWRYLHYANGDEELYDVRNDPYEWTNLAADSKHTDKLAELRALAPKKFAPLTPPRDETLPRLKWIALNGSPAPASKPDGNAFDVVFINRHKASVDLFWMNRQGQPKLYGEIETGDRKRQRTRPGAVWLITNKDNEPLGYFSVGDRSSRAVVPAGPNEKVTVDDFKVTSPPPEMKLDPFYKKYVSAHGYPVVSSDKVNDYALKETAYLINMMLAKRPDVRDAMIKSGSRMIIMAHNEYTTDIPEHSRHRPKDYWDARARGLGGSRSDPVCSCAEENVLAFEGDPYSTESIVIHEFAHNIHLRGMVNVDDSFDDRLKATYDNAMAAGLWAGKYASVNHAEYFAEGVQSWFDNNRQPDHDHNHVDTRKELKQYDPRLAAICEEVFGDTELVYTKPTTRLSGHLTGYDPTTSPKFVWPKRLSEARKAIYEKAKARSKKRGSKP